MDMEIFVRKPSSELDELMRAIETLEAEISARTKDLESAREKAATLEAIVQYNSRQVEEIREDDKRNGAGPYSTMTLIEAALAVLEKKGGAVKKNRMFPALVDGGFSTKSKNPIKYVRIALYRESGKENPRLVRVDDEYRLPG